MNCIIYEDIIPVIFTLEISEDAELNSDGWSYGGIGRDDNSTQPSLSGAWK